MNFILQSPLTLLYCYFYIVILKIGFDWLTVQIKEPMLA